MIKEIERFINEFSKLPMVGTRSARKIVLFLLKNRNKNMASLIDIMLDAKDRIKVCRLCGNLDLHDECSICLDETRNNGIICVVETVDDLWVIERSGCFFGKYHVLGGLLSAVDEVTPDKLHTNELVDRCLTLGVKEVILALSMNLDARITACYVRDLLNEKGISASNLASGIPVGGELNYFDDSTITIAFRERK